jgi:hypothetical protein
MRKVDIQDDTGIVIEMDLFHSPIIVIGHFAGEVFMVQIVADAIR